MATTIVIEGLEELQARFEEFPDKLHGLMSKALEESLYALWASVPGYPEEPEGSTYERTGQTGRSLGSGESGGQEGEPDIYEVHGYESAEFGTSLDYAQYPIGDESGHQAWMHQGRWWTLVGTVVEAAQDKIQEIFERMADAAAAWLDGRGL